MNELSRRTSVISLIFGLAFLCVAVRPMCQPGKGLISVIRGEVKHVFPTTKKDSNNFNVATEPLLTKRQVPILSSLNNELALLTEKVSPSIVSIHGAARNGRSGAMQGVGSGMIWSREGHIITNYHVINNLQDLMIRTHDDRFFQALIIGQDPELDIALLKIKATEEFSPLPVGDSDKVKSGHMVFAFGSPYGLFNSVTQGNISSTNRERSLGKDLPSSSAADLFQHSAPLNVGNSGGPLVNIYGEVIGINNAIYDSNQNNSNANGISFSIPINEVMDAAKLMLSNKTHERGILGITPNNITPNWVRKNGFSSSSGIFIDYVAPGTPAYKVGLQIGDIITQINEEEIKNVRQYISLIKRTPPSKNLKIHIWRKGEKHILQTQLMIYSGDKSHEMMGKAKTEILQKIGIHVTRIDKKQLIRLRTNSAVKIVDIVPGSIADGKFEVGDIVFRINSSLFNIERNYYEALINNCTNGKSLHFIHRKDQGNLVIRLDQLKR